MRVHDRHDLRPRPHDLEVEKALVDRLHAAFEPVAVEIDGDDVVDLDILQRAAVGVDVGEDENLIGPRNARADMALGERPDAAGGQDAVHLREPPAQRQDLGFPVGKLDDIRRIHGPAFSLRLRPRRLANEL